MTTPENAVSEPNESTHVRVRIAVAVDRDRNWNAIGYADEGRVPDDIEMAGHAREHVEAGERVSFVEAWVPLPVDTVPQSVQGEVINQPEADDE